MSLFQNRQDRTLYVHDGAANYIVAYVMQILLQFLFTLVILTTMTSEEKNAFQTTMAYTVIITILNELAFGFTPLAYSKVLGQNYYKDIGFKKKISIVQILMLIVIAIALVLAFMPISNIVAELLIKSGFNSNALSSIVISTPGRYILSIFVMCLLPAFAEETIFRGMVARAFSRKNFVFAIFMGGFIFAIMHGNPVQLVHQFAVGVTCCVVYFATGSIYAPIIVHFINNLIAITGNYILYYHPIEVVPAYVFIVMTIVGLILLVVALYFFIVIANKEASLKTGVKKINYIFSKCFDNNKLQKEDETQKAIDEKIQESGLEEMKEIYVQEIDNRSQDERLKGRRAMIFALGLAIAMFVINTITGYIN